jgi:hypothetical protein
MSPYSPGAPSVPQYPQRTPQAPGQYAPQTQRPQVPASQRQQPQEYAFRPNLTNQEYGECLGLERNWKNLWQQYAQSYQQAQYMSPSDPRYAQMSNYLLGLRGQLDAAWNAFTKCIYFRSR